MNSIELVPEGGFDAWEPKRLEHFKVGIFSKQLGQNFLYENEKIRLWNIILKPHERLDFRISKSNFRVTFQMDGFGVSHQGNGKILLLEFKKGDVFNFKENKDQELIWDFENIGIEPLEIVLFEDIIKSSQ